MARTRNARFWVMVNLSPVKITLRPGQELSHYSQWQHDEGWASEYRAWTHNGDHVTVEHATDGTDCDGRLSTNSTWTAPLADLSGIEPGGVDYISKLDAPAWQGVTWPNWQRSHASQRDYAAEAMNY